MNIENLQSHPLFSSFENLENVQQSLQAGELNVADFSATLMEKISQLDGMEGNDFLLENLNLNNADKLQNVAGLLGNFLPVGHKPEKEFDLDDVLQEIAGIAATLEDIEIEGSDPKTRLENLEIKLETLVEELEGIKNGIPELAELNTKVEQLGEEVQKIQQAISKLQVKGESLATHVDHSELVKEDAVKNEQVISTQVLEKSEIDSSIDLENQIAYLAQEVQAIKETLSEKKPVRNSQQKEPDRVERSNEEDSLQLAIQPTTSVDVVNEPKKGEPVAISASVQDIDPNYMKKNLSIKQIIKERPLEHSTESVTLSQQESVFRKPDQEPMIVAGQQKGMIENIGLKEIGLKEIDQGNERVLPKFATDIAMLNRAVTTEHKVEIPPMTKHFSLPGWSKEVGERVVWMHKQAIPSAELRLNPDHLGPIKIKLDVSQDQATVAFTAQYAVVKDAIDASIPKLRELFSAQQLNLTEVNVSQNDSEQKQSKEFEQMGSGAGNGKDAHEIDSGDNPEKAMEIVDEIEAGRAIGSNGVLSIFA